MEVNSIDDLINIRVLTKHGIALNQLRRYGGIVCPDAADWFHLDRGCSIKPHASLSILLVWYLISKHILIESSAISVVVFFNADVTRYVEQTKDVLNKSSNLRSVPVIMLEVIDDRWARLSNADNIFDIKEQKAATRDELLSGTMITHSFAVCLLPLLISLCTENENNSDT